MIQDFENKLTINMSKISYVGEVYGQDKRYIVYLDNGNTITIYDEPYRESVYIKREDFIKLWAFSLGQSN